MAKVKVKKIQLNGDIADQITLLNLQEHLQILEDCNQSIMDGKRELAKHEKETLELNLRNILHLKEMIQYFSD